MSIINFFILLMILTNCLHVGIWPPSASVELSGGNVSCPIPRLWGAHQSSFPKPFTKVSGFKGDMKGQN